MLNPFRGRSFTRLNSLFGKRLPSGFCPTARLKVGASSIPNTCAVASPLLRTAALVKRGGGATTVGEQPRQSLVLLGSVVVRFPSAAGARDRERNLREHRPSSTPLRTLGGPFVTG